MGTKTGIEWTDATWNPIRGCSRVSEGCRNCYAERQALRFSGAGQPYEGLAVLRNGHASWTGKIEFVEKHLLDPLKWKTARRIFVNSMSDLFHENVTDEMRDKIFAVMALCPQHTFQVLTKRPERMLAYMRMIEGEKDIQRWINAAYDSVPNLSPCWAGAAEDLAWPLPNVQLGVSVENQAAADERIPLLLKTPAAVRFISAEPLLGAVDLDDQHDWLTPGFTKWPKRSDRPSIDWVICGGESGPGARPMHPDWARSLRDQCQAAGVPFFFKQWGEWIPFNQATAAQRDMGYRGHGLVYANGNNSLHLGTDRPDEEFGLHTRDLDGNDGCAAVYRVGKHAAGARLDGVEHKAFPEARA